MHGNTPTLFDLASCKFWLIAVLINRSDIGHKALCWRDQMLDFPKSMNADTGRMPRIDGSKKLHCVVAGLRRCALLPHTAYGPTVVCLAN